MENNNRNIKVGVKAITYPEQRNFVGLLNGQVEFSKRWDLYKFPAYFYFKLQKKPHPQWLNLFNDLNLGEYDLLHFFNAVSMGSKPWVTTFEYYLPRGAHQYNEFPKEKKYIRKVIDRLADDSCKKLIALSDFAYNAQINYLNRVEGNFQSIIDKMTIIHPPQKLVVDKIEDKPDGERVHFVFVGADFFRKGGKEILQVFDGLLNENENIELTIVSRMQYGDYASQSTLQDLNEAMELIQKHQYIHHYSSVSNEKVMEFMKSADVALLPSYDETYGYTVLEAQASGCPVITTNGAAFPEINNDEVGWLINVPLDQDRRSVPRTIEARREFSETIKKGLDQIVRNILAKPHQIKEKGTAAIERIKLYHHPKDKIEQTLAIYNAALND